MNCFPCFKKKDGGNMSKKDIDHVHVPMTQDNNVTTPPPPVNNNLREAPLADTNNNRAEDSAAGSENSGVKTYTFRELAAATKNFRQECLLGEGVFGRVFKGILTPSGETVAIRQLDRNGAHGGKEFAVEISKLSLLSHPNLVKLIGYCADGDQRLLVYEYMPSGSLKNHLFDVQAGKTPLDWSTRMKIALGIAGGLEFLHEKTNPSIIYRDLKSSNILLDSENNPRLSEYGLAKLVQSGNSMHVAPRLMGAGAYGYCAPEYERHGELTLKSDVYSFGVVLLELITGRVAMDTTLPTEEQNIVSWAQPIFRDPSRFPDMADPLLRKHFPVTSLNQAVGVAAMCLQEEPSARPLVSDITAALSFLAMAPPEAPVPASLVSILSGRVSTSSQFGDNMNSSRLSTSSLHGDNMDSSRISTSSQFGEHIQSLREKNISCQQNEDNTDISDFSDSDDSDDEEKESTAYDKKDASNKYQSGFNEAKSLGLSSKRNSKKTSASQGYLSRSSSRSNSIGSRDYSIGNSLRCDSNFQGRSNNSSKQEFQDYDDSSSSNEELSNQRSRNKSVGINSRNGSRRDAHDKSLSSKNRQESLASSYSYSSSEDEYEEEEEEEDEYDRSNDRPEIANSRNNNIVNPGSGDQNTNKGIADSVSGYKGQDRSTVGSAFVHKVKSVNNVRSISKVKSGVNNKVRKAKSGVTRRP